MNVDHHETKTGPKRKKRKYRIVGVSVSPVVKTPVTASSSTTAESFSKSRHERIAEIAYHKAERRGFVGGDRDRDWHEAELEVEELLRKGRPF